MPRPAKTPWNAWNGKGFTTNFKPVLTFVEVCAIKQANATGRFGKASLARIYDIDRHSIERVIAGTYRYHREE